jgi:heme exporter protein D
MFEMWRWRKMEKISWTDRVRNEEVLHKVKEERNILHTVKRRKADWVWIGHILRRNCLLNQLLKETQRDR